MIEGLRAFGDGAVRFARPAGVAAAGLLAALRGLRGVEDVVITEAHVCVWFDEPVDFGALRVEAVDAPVVPEIEIGVRYDGPDLAEVAAAIGGGVAEVIALHGARVVEVQVVGFLPGFAYLGPVDPRLALPRRATPRARVPAGAVGIAGGYTGVYPFASPGGWHLIGTAVGFRAFSPEGGAALRLGQRVRFREVRG